MYIQKGIHSVFNIGTFYKNNTAVNILVFHSLNLFSNTYMYCDGRVADYFRLIYDEGREVQFKKMDVVCMSLQTQSITRLMDQYCQLNPLLSIC